MKIYVLANFGPFCSVGGSESVIKNIAEILTKDYGYEINVHSFNCKSSFCENGVKYFPCEKGNEFIFQINQNDSIFIYSDSFWGFDTLLHNINKINCKIFLSLVGAYHLQSHPESLNLLKKNINKFNLSCHAKGCDYQLCMINNLKVDIIPNGVNLSEFRENKIDFRKKYNIKKKYIILSISNFFYGKGQEHIADIEEKLNKERDDFKIIQISHSVDYPYDKIFREKAIKKCKNTNTLFLRDISRKDVVSAFLYSDIFLFPSKKEVFPLVINECRAAKLPWIALDVGNITEQKGGIVIYHKRKDYKGYVIIDNSIIKSFADNINTILNNGNRNKLIESGQENIEDLDWSNICKKYYKVFNL